VAVCLRAGQSFGLLRLTFGYHVRAANALLLLTTGLCGRCHQGQRHQGECDDD
jgi:hypothetical protein